MDAFTYTLGACKLPIRQIGPERQSFWLRCGQSSGVRLFGRDPQCICLDACIYTLVAFLPPFEYSYLQRQICPPPPLIILNTDCNIERVYFVGSYDCAYIISGSLIVENRRKYHHYFESFLARVPKQCPYSLFLGGDLFNVYIAKMPL